MMNPSRLGEVEQGVVFLNPARLGEVDLRREAGVGEVFERSSRGWLYKLVNIIFSYTLLCLYIYGIHI